MRKFHLLFTVIALALSQQALALDETTTTTTPAATTTTTTTTAATTEVKGELKQCVNIAKACNDAGFTKNGAAGKKFWKDCMRPIVLGKTVAGVTTDASDVKGCRSIKIKNLERKLDSLKEVTIK